MSKRKKPTIKELNQLVLENRSGINIAFNALNEIKTYTTGLDKLFDWYVEYKKDIDGFSKFIEENKASKESDNTDGAKDSVSDKQQDIPKEKPSEVVSEKTK
tara:strand:- start:911 stop:1216 length:306 start_codon:yes stop_codon:yes gene_type:complete